MLFHFKTVQRFLIILHKHHCLNKFKNLLTILEYYINKGYTTQTILYILL